MKKLLTEVLQQRDRDIRNFVLNSANQDMFKKVFKNLNKKERSDISAMLFDFDNHQADRFAKAIENHEAIIAYRYATEKDFSLPIIKVELSDDVRWSHLWEDLLFDKFEDESFQIDPNDVSTMTPQQLCNKYFPTESI